MLGGWGVGLSVPFAYTLYRAPLRAAVSCQYIVTTSVYGAALIVPLSRSAAPQAGGEPPGIGTGVTPFFVFVGFSVLFFSVRGGARLMMCAAALPQARAAYTTPRAVEDSGELPPGRLLLPLLWVS
eukprot:Hpha_TRINITY_DN19643_c0_g1::TRINITY_DN19643_c0_g1_i1::g.186134::m.186134